MKSYHKRDKRDKFDYAIMGIFICAIIVSFDHTIELYKSAGFDTSIGWLNSLTDKWIGKDFFTLALFATLAAEAAFSVGLWGLYEAFRVDKKFPGLRYKWTWGMFIGGLIVIGWSNIGGTLGTNYLFGNPVKGFVLGLSVPYFVLNAVLVNFSRSHHEETESSEQPVQQKLSIWAASLGNAVNTFREATKKPEHISKEQPEQIESEQRHDEQQEDEQPKPEHEKQSSDEQPKSEQPVQKKVEQNKQNEREQQKRKLYIVNGGSKTDQAVQCALKMMERNEQFTVRELAKMVGCSPATAQNAMNRLKKQKQA